MHMELGSCINVEQQNGSSDEDNDEQQPFFEVTMMQRETESEKEKKARIAKPFFYFTREARDAEWKRRSTKKVKWGPLF
jgi:hypothetical protein